MKKLNIYILAAGLFACNANNNSKNLTDLTNTSLSRSIKNWFGNINEFQIDSTETKKLENYVAETQGNAFIVQKIIKENQIFNKKDNNGTSNNLTDQIITIDKDACTFSQLESILSESDSSTPIISNNAKIDNIEREKKMHKNRRNARFVFRFGFYSSACATTLMIASAGALVPVFLPIFAGSVIAVNASNYCHNESKTFTEAAKDWHKRIKSIFKS